MAKKYGNTWWGQQWLKALEGIDYDNRLPRGRTYANKGLVKDVLIENGEIKAKVQGSAPRPYKQTIAIAPFTLVEKAQIVQAITENPFILSALLNKQLPQELLTEIQTLGIKLFPNSWKDMKANCSCPDWALPCKHLAAVIYVVGTEIDKNPFMVFLLRGLDVLDELQRLGFTSGGNFKLPILEIKELYSQDILLEDFPFDPSLTQKIDFSKIPYSEENILKLLDPNPLFFTESDLKSILQKNYKSIAKEVSKSWQLSLEDLFAKGANQWTIHIELEGGFRAAYWHIEDDKGMIGKKGNASSFVDVIQQINPAHLGHYSPAVFSLFWIHQFAKHLITKSAYIPELVQIQTDTYTIRWIPALLIKEVKAVFDILYQVVPPNLLIRHKATQSLYTNSEEQLKALLSLFLNYYVYQYGQDQPTHWRQADILETFFSQSLLNTKGFERQENAQAIQKWLQKFYLADKSYLPILKIEEDETEEGIFLLNFWIQDKEDILQEPAPLKDIFAKKKYEKDRLEIIQDLAVLAEYLPPVKELIRDKGKYDIVMNNEDFVEVFLNTLPSFELLGIKILLPKALRRLSRPRLSMQIQSEGSVGSSGGYVNFADLLTFDWQIALGDSTISTKEFLKMVKKLRGIVKINGEYVLIDEKELQNILRKIENPPNISTSDLLKASLSEDYQGAKVTLDKKVREMIRTLTENEAVALPQNLKATLRPYQERGYAWMYKNTQVGFGSLLADDMGLGKTLQVISLLLKFKEEKRLDKKKALVVVPTTLLGNWEREIQKFAPDLNAWVYHGPKRSLELQENEVILTSYGVARSDEKILNKVKWGFLIIDEAQNIKNTQTAQTKAIKKIKSDVRIAMSGTPVENRLSEYWSIFDFTNKGYLDSLKRFKDEFIEPIEKERSQEHLDRFQKVTAPFILRRVKSDKSIIQDLPDKIETDQICTLTAEQSALYQNIVNLSLEEIQKEDGMSRRGLIFQMMTALKQICNHPNQYLKKKEIDPELSGKTQLLISLLDSIYENDEKTLIFTQYKEMGDLLAKLIEERYHQAPLWLHGGTSRKKRDEMVQDFQTQSHIKIMLLSLKAGGTGLNLTAANNVIHYDLWWNPAVENQATDRAYRIGQKKNVMVYRMITQGTFEENINGMIKAKKELADLTVNTGENWVTEMSNEDLKDIFGLKG
jgi:SNF2 family DNA or RNA helicase/uncharacterized Zn finger protein